MELHDSAVRLAEEYDSVEMIKIGESGEGCSISYLKIGDEPRNARAIIY